MPKRPLRDPGPPHQAASSRQQLASESPDVAQRYRHRGIEFTVGIGGTADMHGRVACDQFKALPGPFPPTKSLAPHYCWLTNKKKLRQLSTGQAEYRRRAKQPNADWA
jgi:hypothetical protein